MVSKKIHLLKFRDVDSIQQAMNIENDKSNLKIDRNWLNKTDLGKSSAS